ncbi:type II toxin-antitoxin system VapC family toxin [Microvirga puerhi]|uniref:Type II toxin-antitoxin system VapC family toxin n=1 Tax=Microvirga puerhi TaxID=2876078 RepID=A0ABS7VTF9_9HYPH|nr:type II toxin-antitoxin system VapC family toxin [Microvirga puerhi]MBZ6078851.1 type II toxin-antitoxin system VapC family toxin [Microvirga puerhi]
MYLDSSAILAIMLDEPEAETLGDRIDQATTKLITSPVSVFEAAVNLARLRKVPQEAGHELVSEFLTAGGVSVVSITPEVGKRAIQAYSRYGKGTGHKAQLNMGDVFSYGCAKHYSAPLLYKGEDFIHTDLG